MVKEMKEIPAKKLPPSPTSAAAAGTVATTDAAIPDLTTSDTKTKNGKVDQIYGVGINLAFVQPPSSSSSNPRVGVHSLEPAGSASKAGLQPGDIILSANSATFHYESKYYLPDAVAAAIRGPEGSHVKILVERNGKKLEFDLIREPIGVVTMATTTMTMTTTATTHATTGSVPSDPPAAPCAIEVDGVEKKSMEDQSPNKEIPAASSTTSTKNPDTKKKNAFDSLFHSLSLSVDEQHNNDEKELASSLEDADQFDNDIVVATTVASSATGKRSSSSSSSFSVAASFEEKTIDDDDDDDNKSTTIEDDHSTSTNQQWEMLSERSGSTAILISFSGSMSNASYSFPYRSPSPSVLKNKFVLTESNGEAYIYHVVLPTDTLQGLCLAYKLSATRLRMENNFSGNSLQLAPKKLRIPNNVAKSNKLSSLSSKGEGGVGGGNNNNKGVMIRVQDTTSKEYKLYAFVAEIPSMELVEAKAYLDLSNWDLEEALRSAREDEGWSLRNNDGDGSSSHSGAQGGGELYEYSPSMIMASVKPKALTAHDIYSGMLPYDGDGFELRDVKQR